MRKGGEEKAWCGGRGVAMSLIGCLVPQQQDQSICCVNCEINWKVWPWRFILDVAVRPIYHFKKQKLCWFIQFSLNCVTSLGNNGSDRLSGIVNNARCQLLPTADDKLVRSDCKKRHAAMGTQVIKHDLGLRSVF